MPLLEQKQKVIFLEQTSPPSLMCNLCRGAMASSHGHCGLQGVGTGNIQDYKQPNPVCSRPFCETPGRGWNLGVRALMLAVLSVPKTLVTSYCQMASLSEPVVSTSALNITTLIPFPRWWQRDNALGTLESLERNVFVPFQEDSGIC